MRLLILFSTILLFSCASPQNSVSGNLNKNNTRLDESSVNSYNSVKKDLTIEISKFPTVSVRGIGPRASIYLINQVCTPMFILNGEMIQDYHTVYNAVDTEILKSIKIVPPRQAAIYGLRASSGVILITTASDLASAE